jgi:hypothetical protein
MSCRALRRPGTCARWRRFGEVERETRRLQRHRDDSPGTIVRSLSGARSSAVTPIASDRPPDLSQAAVRWFEQLDDRRLPGSQPARDGHPELTARADPVLPRGAGPTSNRGDGRKLRGRGVDGSHRRPHHMQRPARGRCAVQARSVPYGGGRAFWHCSGPDVRLRHADRWETARHPKHGWPCAEVSSRKRTAVGRGEARCSADGQSARR